MGGVLKRGEITKEKGGNIRNSDSDLASAPPPRIHMRRTQRSYAKGGCAHDGSGTEAREGCVEVEEDERCGRGARGEKRSR